MQISLNGISLLFAATIVVGVFAAVVLLLLKTNKRANRILATLLLATSLWLVDAFFNVSGIYRARPAMYFMPIYYSFAFGPLVLFYVKSLVDINFRWQKQHLWHFLPVALQGILYWSLVFQSYEVKRWFWFAVHRPVTHRIEFDGTLISLGLYLFVAIRILVHYQRMLPNQVSELSKINLQWLKVFLLSLTALSFQWFLEVLLREFFDLYYHYDNAVFVLAFSVLLLSLGGILQSSVAPVGLTLASPEKEDVVAVLDPAVMEAIRKEMEETRAFLNPGLTLKAFAQGLDLPPRIVSEHINHGYRCSFIDFVNRYRVEEVKRRLRTDDPAVLTLLGIAQESGFNSKATFHRVFKQFTGLTPAEYQAPR